MEEQDVVNVQEWIQALLSIGYQFPSVHRSFYHNSTKKKERNILRTPAQSILHNRRALSNLGTPINGVASTKYVQESCDPSRYQLTFASSDLHDGPRVDVSSTLLNMGQMFVQLGQELWKTGVAQFSEGGRNAKNNKRNKKRPKQETK